jgi:hypothetical protein
MSKKDRKWTNDSYKKGGMLNMTDEYDVGF